MKKREASQKERFETVYEQGLIEVIIDRNTGVNYMVYCDEHVTPLYDSDGKILVTPVPSKAPEVEW